MTQEVEITNKKEKAIVVLDSEKVYSGEAKPSDEEKNVRKAIGLPVTKELIYYQNIRDASSAVPIKTYRLCEMYQITDRWYTIEISLENGKSVKIHSDYLIQMQKPSFIADMAEEAKGQA